MTDNVLNTPLNAILGLSSELQELDRLKEENKKLQEELSLMKKAFEVSYRMLGDKP